MRIGGFSVTRPIGREKDRLALREASGDARGALTWDMDRPLTPDESHLIRWMLQRGNPEAQAFLPQLEKANATPWRCLCGCASVNLSIDGLPEPSGRLHVLADFIFGTEADLCGIFVSEKSGILAGLEIYGLATDAPKTLPLPEALRPFADKANEDSRGG